MSTHFNALNYLRKMRLSNSYSTLALVVSLKGKITMRATATIGIITVSDRASSAIYEDLSGPAICETLDAYLTSEWQPEYRLIPDERALIETTLKELADDKGCCLIVTTGGTGPAARDVTPEATEAVCDRMMPGFGELMRAESLKYVSTAILSRQTAGLRGSTLIINLPGKPKAIRQCLDAVFPAVPYCIDLMEGPYLECDEAVIKPFRPKA
jgi:molybdopterin adenylyltransferase